MCRIVVYDTQNRLSDRMKGHLRIDKIRGNEECTQKEICLDFKEMLRQRRFWCCHVLHKSLQPALWLRHFHFSQNIKLRLDYKYSHSTRKSSLDWWRQNYSSKTLFMYLGKPLCSVVAELFIKQSYLRSLETFM